MGEYANELVDQEMFGKKETFKPKYEWYERTPSEKKIASIRKEIAIMVKEQNIDINIARKTMNDKYGWDWRSRGLISNDDNQWSEEDLKEFL